MCGTRSLNAAVASGSDGFCSFGVNEIVPRADVSNSNLLVSGLRAAFAFPWVCHFMETPSAAAHLRIMLYVHIACGVGVCIASKGGLRDYECRSLDTLSFASTGTSFSTGRSTRSLP